MDPHTAVAWAVAEQYREVSGDARPMVVVSTASPYKFGRSVLTALEGEEAAAKLDEFACSDELEKVSGLPMPRTLRELPNKQKRHNDVVEPASMHDEVRLWAK